jgi:hypothetical protein
MIKKLLVLATLTATLTTYASPFTIQEKVKTTNERLDTHNRLHYGYETTLTTDLSHGLYVEANVIKYSDVNRLGYGSLVGLSHTFGKFTPYVEVSWDFDVNAQNKVIETGNYDFGTSYAVTDSFSPTLEIENICSLKKETFKPGVMFKMSKKLTFSSSFGWAPHTGSDSVEAAISYAI